jgi:hypothetical protein
LVHGEDGGEEEGEVEGEEESHGPIDVDQHRLVYFHVTALEAVEGNDDVRPQVVPENVKCYFWLQ